MATLLDITDATFEQEVLQADVPTLVDFWAEWCGPCRMMAPMLEKLAAEQDGKLKVVKLDVQANMEVATRYGVASLPTMILFVAGQEAERLPGYQPLPKIKERIAAHVASGS